MKTGTLIKGTLIVEMSKFKHCANIETAISIKRNELKTAIYKTGIEIYNFGIERSLEWSKQIKNEEDQIRQDFTLILSKPLSKNKVYEIINTVQAQPLKFN